MLILTFENFETRTLDYYSFENGALERIPQNREQDVIRFLNRHPCDDPDFEHGVVVRRHFRGKSFKVLADQKAPGGCRSRVIFGYGDRMSLRTTGLAVQGLSEVSGLTVSRARLDCLVKEISKACISFYVFLAAVLVIATMIIVVVCQK